MKTLTENEVAQIVVDAALKVHRELGPGLLESIYENALRMELESRGIEVRCQHPIRAVFEGVDLGDGYRCDLLVANLVIVEVKSVEQLAQVHFKQVLTYLRLADRRLGLLINFNVALIKDGIRRIVNKLQG